MKKLLRSIVHFVFSIKTYKDTVEDVNTREKQTPIVYQAFGFPIKTTYKTALS